MVLPITCHSVLGSDGGDGGIVDVGVVVVVFVVMDVNVLDEDALTDP